MFFFYLNLLSIDLSIQMQASLFWAFSSHNRSLTRPVLILIFFLFYHLFLLIHESFRPFFVLFFINLSLLFLNLRYLYVLIKVIYHKKVQTHIFTGPRLLFILKRNYRDHFSAINFNFLFKDRSYFLNQSAIFIKYQSDCDY